MPRRSGSVGDNRYGSGNISPPTTTSSTAYGDGNYDAPDIYRFDPSSVSEDFLTNKKHGGNAKYGGNVNTTPLTEEDKQLQSSPVHQMYMANLKRQSQREQHEKDEKEWQQFKKDQAAKGFEQDVDGNWVEAEEHMTMGEFFGDIGKGLESMARGLEDQAHDSKEVVMDAQMQTEMAYQDMGLTPAQAHKLVQDAKLADEAAVLVWLKVFAPGAPLPPAALETLEQLGIGGIERYTAAGVAGAGFDKLNDLAHNEEDHDEEP